MPTFMGLLCCILCLEVEENLDHLLWNCSLRALCEIVYFMSLIFVSLPEGCSYNDRGVLPSFQRETIECLEVVFWWFVGMCTLLWDLWGETNNRVFKSVDRGPSEIWSLVFFVCPYLLSFFLNKISCFYFKKCILKVVNE